MPGPPSVECPSCFSTFKLKAVPPDGAKIRCRSCETVFRYSESSVAEAPLPELPARRSTSKRSSNRKRREQEIPWKRILVLAVVLLSVGGLGVGLFTAREAITVAVMETVGPGVDLDYCVSNGRQVTMEYRIAEAIKTGAISTAERNSEDVQKSSQALRELLGIDLEQVTLFRVSFTHAALVGNGQSGVMVIQSSQNMKRPAAAAFTQQGVKCFRLKATKSKLDSSNSDTMFFANSTTAVIAKESSVRTIIDNWKASAPKREPLPSDPPSLLRMVYEQPVASQILFPIDVHLLAAQSGFASQGGHEITMAISHASLNTHACCVTARGGGTLSWELVIHPGTGYLLPNASPRVEQLRTQFEKIRAEVTKIQSRQQGRAGGAQQSESSYLTIAPRVDSNRLVFALPNVPEAKKTMLRDLLKGFQNMKLDTEGTPLAIPPAEAPEWMRTASTLKQEVQDWGTGDHVAILVVEHPSMKAADLDESVIRKAVGSTRGSRGKGSAMGPYVIAFAGIEDFRRRVETVGTIQSINAAERMVTILLKDAKD